MSRRPAASGKPIKEPLAPLDTAIANANYPTAPAPAQAAAEPLVSRRTVALTLLVLQNASVSLLTRLSRTPRPGKAVYIPAVAVFTAELVKLSVSLTMLVREKRSIGRSKGKRDGVLKTVRIALWDLAVNQRQEIVKLAVPAALYALQNTLLYTALSNLDAATYQTTYQLKLLTTALFSLLFFHRSLTLTKWFSLFLLTAGVAIVQLDSSPSSSSSKITDTHNQDPRVGLAAILAACISSGLAGGWFEWVLKSPAASTPSPPPQTPSADTPTTSSPAPGTPLSASSTSSRSSSLPRLRENSPSLWARNLQLSVPSLVFSLSGVFLSPQLEGIAPSQVWVGFSPLVWSVVLNQALGGLLVAMVVRYADSVAKGFATSLAIVLSTFASVIFFGLVPGPLFILGAGLVISSTIIYAVDKEE
ncbi:nucleotide-sugar transporter-domain-containing protein [Leucosporidium creatinivorum]|uniref:Nucleotide-sugar transporter-domain-containing protein n=1 Tax=Leucosporidium creatinivorum TaxID=106004 RepID=A0A1Y2FZX5_9BASI|nr:nucleotide-sugar transporter-domain-containing protein [Leucosporidium creatinivorum]